MDADEVTGQDSAATFGLIRTTWTSIKAFLKTYFDGLYLAKGNEVYSFAISDETTSLTTVTTKITVHWPYNFTLASVFIGVNTGPTVTTLVIDIRDNSGNTIFSTKPTILVNELTSLTKGTQPVLVTTSFTKGQKLTVNIDQVGSTIAGKGLKIYMIGTKS